MNSNNKQKLNIFSEVYKGKKVLVTGHTGFKGSWLSLWLSMLGSKVIGYSAYLPSNPCNFKVCELEKSINHITGDVRDIKKLRNVFTKYNPEIVFHLAAQPIVKRSYKDPKLTFDTNVGGTVNVLECLRTTESVKAAVIITSDKCYRNLEWEWGYRESDILGGDDPYSASKAGAELATRAYIESFFRNKKKHIKVATTRAGNVIGGGDWAEARIVPDCIRAWSQKKEVVIRNPNATRPWQHVLEPLSGYLWLGANLFLSDKLHGEAFNFGPDQKTNESVRVLIETFLSYWGEAKWKYEKIKVAEKESMLLKLSCDKALHFLKWFPVLNFNEAAGMTAEWYKAYYLKNTNMYNFTVEQINSYISKALKLKLMWVKRKGE